MDSVKNKMESLLKERDDSQNIAVTMEQDCEDLKQRKVELEKGITACEKDISKAEDQLDKASTATRDCLEKLEKVTTTATSYEDQVQALTRKIQLVAEESSRVNERLQDTLSKLASTEIDYEENERARKVIDGKNMITEEKLEMTECQLTDAQLLAAEAEQKSESIDRKLRMIETEFERIVDRAEQFESKSHDHEVQIKQSNDRMVELEIISGKNNEAEDNYEKQIFSLTNNFQLTEAKAEFGERTVEKLEKTIDGLDDSLYHEKKNFQEISIKIDAMLGDMKAIHDMEAKMMSSIAKSEESAKEQVKSAPKQQTASKPEPVKEQEFVLPNPEPVQEPVEEPEPVREPTPEPTVVEMKPVVPEEEGPGAPAEVIEEEVANPTNITVTPGQD